MINATISSLNYVADSITEVTTSGKNSSEPNVTSSVHDTYRCDQFVTSGSILGALWFQIILYILYGVVFVVALLGNALVCYVVWSSPRMKTVTNYFIVNLALGDLLMAVFCVPTSFVSTIILQYWPFGSKMCPGVNFAQAVSVLVSAYTLVTISIDRFVAIMWPLSPRTTRLQAKLLIVAVWILAVTVSSPIAAVSELQQPDEKYHICDQFICAEHWPEGYQRYYYSISLLILQYLVPLVVLIFTYSSIAIRVWGKRPPGEAENTRDQRMAKSKLKMIKMMMAVVIAFTVCWLPFNVLTLILDNNDSIHSWKGLPVVWATLHWLSMSHSCYNPVIYCWMNGRFRSGFIIALGSVPGLRRALPEHRLPANTSTARVPHTGNDGANGNFSLRRINTFTTYVSMRRAREMCLGIPVRSASVRNCESRRIVRNRQENLVNAETHNETQV
ncbi:RYamide receptor isoform X2 [Diachasmimorpha longicaudata]|uniref:RYamide receptor isoform X2 n=1 Tax=Diachasmimorpha longicaudata TaxID=58733 RepID=UPI0030B8B0E7